MEPSGPSSSPAAAAASASYSSSASSAQASAVALPVAPVQPAFHMAPLVLGPPPAEGVGDELLVYAKTSPLEQAIAPDVAQIDTARLTPDALAAFRQSNAGKVYAKAAPIVAKVFTPAQIRAAYGMSVLPAVGSSLTTAAAAALGAGQTIYIVDAFHNPSTLADLNTFSKQFGLPTCTALPVTTVTALPLAAPVAMTGCELAIVPSTTAGMVATALPAYDATWASEIALDVQWAHAIAPLARIVLIEAANGQTAEMVGAVNLANKMGPGVVSMSFAAPEGSWTASLESSFSAKGMTYLAATGDWGSQVNWPAVSPNVLAVGGTSLGYTGTGMRSEVAWSKTGGGLSAFTPKPAYQSATTLKTRGVADVAFNADPMTGQYVSITKPGTTTAGWYSFGGTSISTPQWAGLVAVANATRALQNKPTVGAVHPVLYKQIASSASSYSASFSDIATGNNGTCATCSSGAGYDVPTGLGTPNTASLMTFLTATALPPVPASNLTIGNAGTAYSAQWAAIDSFGGALKYSLVGGPTGLAVNGSATLSWASPVAGVYGFTVLVSDVLGQQSAASLTLSVAAPVAPAIIASSSVAKAGVAFSTSIRVVAPAGSALTYTLTNAPTGMMVSSAGVVSWAKPVTGTYTVGVVVKAATGGVGSSNLVVTVAAGNKPPVISTPSLAGVAGAPFSVAMQAIDPDGDPVEFGMSYGPSGLAMSLSGELNWAQPEKGKYIFIVTARDPQGSTSMVAINLTIG